MIPSIFQGLMMMFRARMIKSNHIFCLKFIIAHPEWGLAWITERLSPWSYASQYKNIPIQIQRVYSPLFGSFAWCARVQHSELGWDNLGSVHDDLKIVFEHAQEYIDEMGIGIP